MHTQDLLPASPESLGIPSQAITNFIQTLQNQRLCMHSILILRKGKLAAEGYAPPWNPLRKHRMYSVSKSFTSTAVGMAYDEGLIHLQARVYVRMPKGFEVIIDKEYGEIFGVHILGPRATDLIAQCALAIGTEATAEDIVATIHAHPTVAEAVREAVMAANKNAIHIPNK